MQSALSHERPPSANAQPLTVTFATVTQTLLPHYRPRVVDRFPNLTSFDDSTVLDTERVSSHKEDQAPQAEGDGDAAAEVPPEAHEEEGLS